MSKETIPAKTDLGEEVLRVRKNRFTEFEGKRSYIDDLTNLYTIVGLGHLETKARFFHETVNQSLELNQHHLRPIEVQSFEDGLEDFINTNLRGMTVTIPYKQDAYKAIQSIGAFGDELTQLSGAVNTIICDNGKLYGWNTDIDGFLGALNNAQVDLKGRVCSIVGAGGMGRAAMCGLGFSGAKLVRIFDTDFDKSEKTVNDIKNSFPETEFIAVREISDCVQDDTEIIAQCSSEGMASATDTGRISRSPVPAAFIPKQAAVIDAVYVPLETQFLKEAKQAGCNTIILGSKIVVFGGLRQVQLYLGESLDIPENVINKAEKAIMEGVFAL